MFRRYLGVSVPRCFFIGRGLCSYPLTICFYLLYFITDATFGEKGAFMLQMTESILTALKSPPRKKPVVTANTTIYGITGRTYQYSQTLKALGAATARSLTPSRSTLTALRQRIATTLRILRSCVMYNRSRLYYTIKNGD